MYPLTLLLWHFGGHCLLFPEWWAWSRVMKELFRLLDFLLAGAQAVWERGLYPIRLTAAH